MPRIVKLTHSSGSPTPFDYPLNVSVATDAELVEFVNKARKAGGANMIEALLPSEPCDPNACLVANALNFSCTVDVDRVHYYRKNEHQWAMHLPSNMDKDRVKLIVDALGCEYEYDEYDCQYLILLPRHIGNAAHAFDSGDAFQEYKSEA